MRKLIATAILITLVGCGGVVQRGSMIKVAESYDEKDWDTCLLYVNQAKEYGERTPAIDSETTLYTGLCLEGRGDKREAEELFKKVIRLYPDSDAAARAKGRLK